MPIEWQRTRFNEDFTRRQQKGENKPVREPDKEIIKDRSGEEKTHKKQKMEEQESVIKSRKGTEIKRERSSERRVRERGQIGYCRQRRQSILEVKALPATGELKWAAVLYQGYNHAPYH